MSYLDRLRLHFAGRFQATVSTVNNDPTHFNNAAFKPAYQQRQTSTEANGWWNPDGNGAWRLLGCTVRSAFYADGSAVPPSDSVLEMIVADSDRMAPAKIVDLDSEQQLVSTIFGLEVRIADASGNTLLRGRFQTAPFDDIWARSQGDSPGGDANAGAMWQSQLRDVEWGDVSRSRFLSELRAAAKDGLLSIKFNVDRYSMDWNGDLFCSGRIVGSIGPASSTEPVHLTLGRQLLAEFPVTNGFPAPAGGINNCVAVLDDAAGKLRIDLGNALPSTYSGDTLYDIGALSLAYLGPPDSNGQQPLVSIGTIAYLEPGWYERTAGVVELPAGRALSKAELETLKQSSLALVTQNAGKSVTAISEAPGGLHVGVDQFVFRLSPGERASVNLYATLYGQSLPAARILCFFDPNGLQPSPGAPDVATPLSALQFPARVVADERGRALLELEAKNPEHARDYIDGQVYGVRYALESTLDYGVNYPFCPSDFVSVLVFDEFRPDEPLAWHGSERGSIWPMFQQYANLYPVMSRFLDMGKYEDVCRHLDMLRFAFSLPIEDPNSMPVTRDLSPAKRQAILRWLTALGPDGKPRLGTPPPPKPTLEAAAPARPSAARGGKASAFANTVRAQRRR